MRLAAAGIAVGLALSAASVSLVQSLLFGVSPWDPATFAIMAALLAGIALFACWGPARRATRVDPLVSLRSE
jgi:putative ABC transport system permease protein